MEGIFEKLTVHFFRYEFVYIFILCSLIFLITAIFVRKAVIVVLCSLFLSLAATEYVLSFNDRYSYGFSARYPDYINTDKIIVGRESSVYENGKQKKYCGNVIHSDKASVLYDVRYSLYDGGDIRYTKCDINSKISYVFLGCSFAFGYGVNDDQTLPYCFSRKMGFKVNVLNCGVRGHSSNAALNILNGSLIENTCKNSDIKNFFYEMILDQIYRNFRILDASDAKRYKNNKLSYIYQPYGKIKILFARSYIFRKIFLPYIDEHNLEFYTGYMVKSLIEMDNIVRKKYNSKLTIVMWPEFKQVFIDELRNRGLDVIVLPKNFNSESLGYRIPYDRHPTAKANEEIAEILYNHINKKDKFYL